MISIDPGVRGCGVAEFREEKLAWAGYLENPRSAGNGYEECREMALEVCSFGSLSLNAFIVVIEKPRIYPGPSRDKKGNMRDTNDLIDVACVGSAIAACFEASDIVTVFPAEWKGQAPKDVMNRRVLATLTDEERKNIESVGRLDHNTLDAVGIGLWYLGRLNKRVFANE